MDGVAPDLGKIVTAGYFNADPPGDPKFALSLNGSGFAASLQLGGGEVTVGPDGGISLLVPGLATIGIDANNDITLASGDGVINILTEGEGNDVNILNAGTIAFDELGEGALTGVQTINGAVYPPPGGGGTSITQGGALVACLGNGAINISSIGAGVTANIHNAGTIAFDLSGSRAITGISTINGSAYLPFTGYFSSITNTGGTVESRSTSISLATSGNSFMALYGTGAPDPNKVEITSGSGNAAVVLGPSNTILLDNPGATVASFITMYDDGEIELSGAAVNIGNLSTVNGVQFVNGSAPYVLPSDVNFSTITLGTGGYLTTSDTTGYVEAQTFQGYPGTDTNVYAASGQALYLAGGQTTTDNSLVQLLNTGDILMNATNVGGLTDATGLNVSAEGVTLQFPLDPTSTSGVGAITHLSTINGVAYPFAVTTIGDIATGGFVSASTSNVLMGVGATALSIDSGNAITVGSVTADTSIVYASTIQASASGLSIFEITAGANVKLDTGARVKFNEGFSTITDGTGLIVGTEGSTLTFPLDPTSAINVGAIANLSTINGVAYPIPVIQAVYYKSAAQNLTSGGTDITFNLTAAYNNTAGYITHTSGTSTFEVVQDGVYDLDFHATVAANGATWTTTTNKVVAIDITRSPDGTHPVMGQSALIASGTNYSQDISGTYALEAGDVITLRIQNTFSGGPPTASGLLNGFDLNTFFTWRFIS